MTCWFRYTLVSVPLTGLALLMMGMLSGCGRGDAATPAKAPAAEATEVGIGRPERQTLRVTVEQPGQIEGFEQAPLYAKVAGYVQKICADIGDRVTAGQVLAELSVPELQEELHQKEAAVAPAQAEVTDAERALAAAEASLKKAEAALNLAEAGQIRADASYARWQSEYDRVRRLLPRGAVDESTADQTRDQLKSAEAARDESRALRDRAASTVKVNEARRRVAEADRRYTVALLEYTQVRAPFDGVVTRRPVDVGHLVQPSAGPASGTPLFVVVRTDPVRIFVDVPEADAVFIHDGTPARVGVQALSEQEFEGRVRRSSWVLDNQARTLRVQIDLPNPDGRLRPGMYATARLATERPGVLTLPASAVLTLDDQPSVFRVEDGKALRTPVKVGMRQGERVEVLQKQTAPARRGEPGAWARFTGGEEVVLRHPVVLQDGQEVRGRSGETQVAQAGPGNQ
jgi:multidrug efflux pump subunit AcrA (membrane-fusion protein)